MAAGVPFTAIAAAAVAALLALLFHAANDFAPLDTYFPPSPPPSLSLTTAAHAGIIDPRNVSAESYFATSYYEARALFRARTRAMPGASLHTLPLPGFEDEDLTIDVAVVRGSSERAVVHISGTHGVEGFAGSAIQSALLTQLAAERTDATSAMRDARATPTLVFVHALNPYGFAKLRRFNEHNVDLNRNFLTPIEFAQRIAMDPNAFGYVDVIDVLNPQRPVSWQSLPKLLLGAARTELVHGRGSLKRALVSGNYHFPTTIFFGGVEQQASGALLQQLLREHLDMDVLTHVGVIDVHTGLGPPGVDTLLLDVGADRAHTQRIFSGANVAASGEDDDETAKGYDGVVGLLCSGMTWLLPPHVQTECITQEFGTANGAVVLKALVEENAMFHHAPTRRLVYAQQLRDAFYLHRSAQWKADVVARGLRVFAQLETHIAKAA